MTTAAIPRLVVGLLAASVLVACGSGSATEQVLAPAQTTTQPPAWTTYYDQEGGFSIRYPAAWERSIQSLTPGLTDPREIVSVGSYHMRPGGELCAHLPVNALEDLGPEDAFLTVQERAQPHLAHYPPRPIHFDLGEPTEGFDGELCVQEPGDLLQWWLPFRDGTRAFYALVALGTSASEETRQQVTQTLNSFHIDGQPVVVICCEKRVCSLAESGRKGPRGGAGTLAERAGRVRAKPLGTREHSTSFDYAGL